MSEVETTTPAPPQPPVNQGRGRGSPNVSAAAEQMARMDDKSVFEMLTDLGGAQGELRIKLERKYPREWQGHHIAGFLEEFDEPFSEADIKQRFGGGKFQVKVQRRAANGGQWIFAGAKTFEIEGDPRLAGALLTSTPTSTPLPLKAGSDGDTALQAKALDHMAHASELDKKRAWELEDQLRKGNSIDPMLVKLISEPLQAAQMSMQSEMAELRRQLISKDEQVLKLITDSTKDKTPSVIEKTFEHLVAGESHRIEAIRTQHDSELRTMRENHRHDLDQERSRLQTEIDRRERAHEREIGMLRETHAQSLKTVEQSYEARLDNMKHRVNDLERQLTEAKSEVVKLRETKEKGPMELVDDVVKLKNAMEVLGGEPEPTSTWERIIGTVVQSPMAQAVASRVENAPAAPPPQVNPEVMRQRRARAAAARAGQPVAQGSAPGPGPEGAAVVPIRRRPQPRVIELNPLEVATAVTFMEQSIINGTDPRQFAESARSMVPKQVMAALKAQGVDAFLAQTAQLQDGSPLATQNGRNWARKVARYLIEGGPQAPEAEAVEEPPTAS